MTGALVDNPAPSRKDVAVKSPRHYLGLLALPALLLVACGSSSPAAPAGNPAPAPSATAPARGPLTVTTDHCGKFTRAQQVRFSTNARSGLLITVTNRSGGAKAIPFSVQAQFDHGTMLDGTNTTGVAPALTQGQSERLEMDSPPGAGPGDTCKIIAYTVFKPGSVTPAGTYHLAR